MRSKKTGWGNYFPSTEELIFWSITQEFLPTKEIEDTTAEEFDNIMNPNVKAIFNAVKAVVPNMKENGGGVILNTSSMVSIYGQPSGVGYPASKFAVNGLTKSLARELAPFGSGLTRSSSGNYETDMVAALPEAMIQPLIKNNSARQNRRAEGCCKCVPLLGK